MAVSEELKKVLDKLKAQQSQASKPIEPPKVEQEIQQEIEETEDLIEEELPKLEPKPIAKQIAKPIAKPQDVQQEVTKQNELIQKIEMLQNNGIYRNEFLFQLQEINISLKLLVELLVGVSGYGKK